jgi:hypothetical protein
MLIILLLVGFSLSPNMHVANQKDSIDGALTAFPTLEDVARDFDATKDEQQAELSIDDVGRFFKQNKKRVTWTFLGSDGKQHTVSLLWNKRSGKITVAMDDEEIWYGQRDGASVISHKWETKEGTRLHLFASRVTPNGSAPGFRKYALVVDNKEYVLVPKDDGIMNKYSRDYGAPSSIVELLYPNGYCWRE